MTQTELTQRIATYQQAAADGRITEKEMDGFIEALRQIMKEEGL